MESVWRFEQRTFYMGESMVKLIVAYQGQGVNASLVANKQIQRVLVRTSTLTPSMNQKTY